MSVAKFMHHAIEKDPYKRFWAIWNEQDYSWDGLLKHRWVGWNVDVETGEIAEDTEINSTKKYRRANLQDYWRNQKEHLIMTSNGKRYTIVHLPIERWYEEGFEYDVQIKKFSKALLEPEFPAGVSSNKYDRNMWCELGNFVDRRAQLQGVVFPERFHRIGYNELRDHSLNCEHAFFNTGVNFQSCAFSNETSFRHALFGGERSNFSKAKFKGNVDFDYSTFLHGVKFENTKFNYAAFQGTEFYEFNSFDNSQFKKTVTFFHAKTDGLFPSMRSVEFGSLAQFNYLNSYSMDFPNSIFKSRVQIENSKFEECLNFSGVIFNDDFSTKHSEFNGGINLNNAVLGGSLIFDAPTLSQKYSFDNARFILPNRIILRAYRNVLPCVIAIIVGIIFGLFVPQYRIIAYLIIIYFSLQVIRWLLVGGVIATGENRLNDGESKLREWQSSIRKIRKHAEDKSNKEVIIAARIAEIKLSRLRIGHSRISKLISKPIERFFSVIYAIFSDYGNSLLRPLLALVLMTAFSAFTIFQVANAQGLISNRPCSFNLDISYEGKVGETPAQTLCSEDAIWSAVNWSWKNTFAPVYRTQKDNNISAENLLVELLYNQHSGSVSFKKLIFSIVSTFQAGMSVLFVFFFALAARRKFFVG